MNRDRLADLLELPSVQRMIFNNYKGGCSLGLTLNPANKRDVAIRVRIEGDNTADIPSQIVLDGETIPVIVNTNFKVPEPFPAFMGHIEGTSSRFST